MAEYAEFSFDATDQIIVLYVDRIHPQSNKFATGVENKKLNYSPG